MLRKRIEETHNGIQGEFDVRIFGEFAKMMREKGWIETDDMILSGINSGNVLEIGPGPGIKGLEWLKKTDNTKLTALEISDNMISIAKKNAIDYRLSNRVNYIKGNATKEIPFEENTFDNVFSNGSLHEWEKPEQVFNEMYRVLKSGGKLFVSDLRRDINPIMKCDVKMGTKPRSMIKGLITSLNAAYTVEEINEIIKKTDIKNFQTKKTITGITIIATK